MPFEPFPSSDMSAWVNVTSLKDVVPGDMVAATVQFGGEEVTGKAKIDDRGVMKVGSHTLRRPSGKPGDLNFAFAQRSRTPLEELPTIPGSMILLPGYAGENVWHSFDGTLLAVLTRSGKWTVPVLEKSYHKEYLLTWQDCTVTVS